MTKAKHIPLRRCVVCRCSKPQAELLRFYRSEAGWQLDAERRAGGRGAWLCKAETDGGPPSCHNVKFLGRFFRADAARVAQQLNTYYLETLASPTPAARSTTSALTHKPLEV